MELSISRMVRGLLLMKPPSEQDIVSWKIRNSPPRETRHFLFGLKPINE